MDKRPMCKQCNARHGLGHPHVTLQGTSVASVTLHSSSFCAYCAQKDAEITALKAELTALRGAGAARTRASRERKVAPATFKLGDADRH